MNGYTSFTSEHTVEFVLVPQLTTILKKRFKNVIPIYPWITREGTNLSKNIHKDDDFFVLGLFCKRPKIKENEDSILFKINKEFIDVSKIGIKLGIPIIAGCPIANNLWGLNKKTECIWSKLNDSTVPYYKIAYNPSSTGIDLLKKNSLILNENDLLNYVVSNCREMNLNLFIENLRIIRTNNFTTRSLFGFGNYKPLYFLLRN